MKFISGFFKFIAILIMVGVILSLPWGLVARSASQAIYTPETVLSALEKSVINSETLASVAQYVVSTDSASVAPQTEVELLIDEALSHLEHGDWVKLFDLIAPQELVLDSFAQMLQGYYEWIDNNNQNPEMLVDMRSWKSNTITNAVPVMSMVFNALPQCSPEDVLAFAEIIDPQSSAAMPKCRPPEPFYSTLLDAGASTISAQLSQAPDYLDLAQPLMAEAGGDLAMAKQQMLKSRRGMQSGWMGIMFVYIIAIPVGARSVSQLFKWAGWPMLLAGIHLLLISLMMIFFAEEITVWVSSRLLIDVPRTFLTPLEGLMAAVLGYMSSPLLIQTAVMILFGGGALLVSIFLGGEEDEHEEHVYGSTVQGQPPMMASPSQSTMQAPQPVVPVEDPNNSDGEEDERPSGMFG